MELGPRKLSLSRTRRSRCAYTFGRGIYGDR
jgi:hypothetical protein